ncbi:hypothetical protein CYY_000608 [Polysphondylium violaceum]|uniref:Uncharacterized protein n=1 Tax=Polysphondylium violaceum TaxID=133409 RepID=A0A8J4Q4D3_9MYCE|nr:hypothetical protein CYY_000608 [Polysphondylium violaceum]
MSSPKKNSPHLTSQEEIIGFTSASSFQQPQIQEMDDPFIQSTLVKRSFIDQDDSREKESQNKKFPDELDNKSNESGSHCGASPFDPKEVKQHPKPAGNNNSLDIEDFEHVGGVSLDKKDTEIAIGEQQQQQQPQNLSSSISLPFSLEKKEFSSSTTDLNNNNNSNSVGLDNNQVHSSQFVSVPFSPTIKPFTLEKKESNSELPYYQPEGYSKNNNNNNLAAESVPSQTPIPPMNRPYWNSYNTRIGGMNLPLDDEENNDMESPFTRVTSSVRRSPTVNADRNPEEVPMVDININPGVFAEPNGAEVPVVPATRNRRGDNVGIAVIIIVMILILGGCIAFFFI